MIYKKGIVAIHAVAVEVNSYCRRRMLYGLRFWAAYNNNRKSMDLKLAPCSDIVGVLAEASIFFFWSY